MWCSEILFGPLPQVETGILNSAAGPEMMRAGDWSYLLGAEEAAVGGRKAQAPLTSSLRATMNANQSSLSENFKNDYKNPR